MRSEIIVIGGGASGLMAAWSAARTLNDSGCCAQVTVLEKMPRPGRKIMITGKGRCNFTNVKDWNEFSQHIQSGANFVKSSFYNFPSAKVLDFFESHGMKTVVERGDRAFPASYHASEVVDTLVNACNSLGVKIITGTEVRNIVRKDNGTFALETESDGAQGLWLCDRLIIATGGLSYPGTGSTGDGYGWAKNAGHTIRQCFPSLTALVPKGYKVDEVISRDGKFHIDRSTPLSPIGQELCGIQLKNVGVTMLVEGTEAADEFGDIDFTDGGIEGPVGFQISRKCVKSLINGSRVQIVLDMKPGVSLTELTTRIKDIWTEIDKDPRSRRAKEKERCRILLGKLMPWEMIPAFTACHPEIITLERKGRTETKVWINLGSIAKALKAWKFDIAGYVGYERCVITAGGVSTDEVSQKTMESKLCSGLYFCGEILDTDSDTGGYNLQTAFCTGNMAGQNAGKSWMDTKKGKA